ncbi:MAG TPA: glycerol-3-phosphate 1-O-acyltransferase PlsY [Candidatus Acidoferrales bacterium]|nr:glycerol-3-phosphate 1-O-acyltransferase PlsY [Candidatus Acidoferrales bacterium]
MGLLIKLLLSYLLGSVLGSLLLGRLRGVDVRQHGSGNAGATNALRVLGRGMALAVLVIDAGKGIVAVTLIPALPFGPGPGLSWVPILCAFAVVLGHVYPVFHGFKGGKGAATLIGVMLGLMPMGAAWVFAVWLLVLVLTGYVGLATLCAALVAPLYVAAAVPDGLASPLGAFALIMAAFVFYTHRENIRRLLGGNENRFERVMLLRRLRR